MRLEAPAQPSAGCCAVRRPGRRRVRGAGSREVYTRGSARSRDAVGELRLHCAASSPIIVPLDWLRSRS